MSKDATDLSWMDEHEPGSQPGLTCHVEIENESGETFREVIASTAAALRNLARQLEEDQLDDGFHDLNSLKGSKIGEVYLDFHSTEE